MRVFPPRFLWVNKKFKSLILKPTLILFLLLAFLNNSLCANIDMIYKKNMFFKIKIDKNGDYLLSSKVNVENKYLSKISTEVDVYPILEPYYTKVTKIKAFQNLRKISGKNIYFEHANPEDIFITDHKIHYIRFPKKIKMNDIVKYEYKKKYDEISYFPLLEIRNLNKLQEMNIEIEHPEDITVNFEFFFIRDSIQYEVNKQNKKKTILKIHEVDYKKELPFLGFNDYHAILLTTIIHNGEIINSTQKENFINWYNKKIELKPTFTLPDSIELKKAVDEAETDIKKIEIIYDFVRKNIRYIADERAGNAYIPKQPEITFKNKYGDCKDKAYLISAIARGFGINVNMALISSEFAPRYKNVHLNQFDHVICSYKDNNGEIIFFDPTHKFCEFKNLPFRDIGKQTFILDKDNPEVVTTQNPNTSNDIKVSITGNIDSLNKCQAKIILKNDYFSRALRARKELSGVELENILSELITDNFYKIAIDYYKFDNEGKDSITFIAKADLSNLLISSLERKYIPQTPFQFFNKKILERKTDEYPIFLGGRMRFELNIDLIVENLSLTEEAKLIGDKNGIYLETSVKNHRDNHILFSYKLFQNSNFYQNKDKDDLLKFCKNYFKMKKKMYILNRSKL